MPKAKLVRFDSVDHQERRPGVVLTSLVDGDTGATQISSGLDGLRSALSEHVGQTAVFLVDPNVHREHRVLIDQLVRQQGKAEFCILDDAEPSATGIIALAQKLAPRQPQLLVSFGFLKQKPCCMSSTS